MNANTGEAEAVKKTAEEAPADSAAPKEEEKAAPGEPPELNQVPPGLMMRYLSWRD